MSKCPNCGAPVTGRTCAYCGSPVSPPAEKKPAEGPSGRGKRNALDILLIAIGGFWVLLVLGAFVDMRMWSSAAEIVAVLMLASPGVVLLLIGCRRKKLKQKKTGT